jgi:capsular exopolysaccharide synthesis family protein
MFDTHPANVWQVVWRRKSLVVLGVLLGLGAGALACTRLTPQYQSSAKVLVVKKRPDAVTGVDTRPLAQEDYATTSQELLKSSAVLERAVQDGKLAELASLAAEKEGPVEALRKALTVSANKGPVGPTNVLKVSFRGREPDDCPVVVNAVLKSFTAFLDKQYQNVSDDTIDLIVRDRNSLQKELAEKEAAYQKFRETSPVLGKGRNGLDLRQERLNNIQAKRSALLLRRVEVESQLAAVEAALKAGGNRDAVLTLLCDIAARGDPDEAPRERNRTLQDDLAKLLLEERKLLDQHGPKHAEVKSVRHRIEAARRLLLLPPAAWGDAADAAKDPVEIHLQVLRQKLDHCKEAEARLTEVFQREQDEAKKLAGDEIRDESFQTQIALTKQLYEGLVKRLREVNLIKGVGGYEVQVLEPPAPAVKAAPNVPLVLALGTFLGGLFGFAAAFLAGAVDRRFRSADEVRFDLGLPVLGSIPAFKPPRRTPSRRVRGAPELDPTLCTYYRNTSAETEAFRGLRNALCFGASGPRVVQVASPQGGEGKSTVSANLAVSAAQSGLKVLLIDADLRRPAADRLFGVQAGPGLAALLTGEAEPPEAVRESGIPGLTVLPAGPTVYNPAELLTSPRLKELLDAARERYDLVVVDTPALLPVTDAGAVARQADGVVLVLHAAKTDKAHARRAREVVEAAGATLLGVVVNAANPGADPLGYGRPAAHAEAVAANGHG